MTQLTNIQDYSLLDVMKWSHLARNVGIITNAEWEETNSLANRLAFAHDHDKPAFVTDAERARFEELVNKVMPNRPEARWASPTLHKRASSSPRPATCLVG